jgi:3-oxoacyl-[acyl-carrier protein] reductase
VNRTVVITGSTRGIGLATAAEFLNHGDRVVIFCRHKSHLKEATAVLSTFGEKENVLALAGDVQESKDVKRIVDRCLKHFKRIDILVNNAGVAAYKPIEETTEKEWNLIINTNLKGTFLFLRQVLPVMKNQETGIIINVSSGLGLEGAANFSAYCASKFGIIGLTRVLADEISQPGIRVYAVLPGMVDTKMLEGSSTSFARELSEIIGSQPVSQKNRKWVYAVLPGTETDHSEMLSPEHVAREIFEAAKGEKKSGALISIYS